jgi:hypothetical protein
MRLAAKYMDEAKELRNVLYQKERELAEKLRAGASKEEVASLRAEIEEIGRRIEDLVALHRYALRMTRISDEELWGEFLGDIRRVIAEPPRRGGESPEEIEERRRFARRLYEMAEEGLEGGGRSSERLKRMLKETRSIRSLLREVESVLKEARSWLRKERSRFDRR